VEITELASQVDIPTTLLSLLGFDKIPTSFMGENLFDRKKPVFINWCDQFLKVTPEGVVEKVSEESVKYLDLIQFYQRLSPPKNL
jgi:phosphoglycerol transferase MdoB-like AlkP superfamily enzyme